MWACVWWDRKNTHAYTCVIQSLGTIIPTPYKAYDTFVSGQNFSPFATHSEVKTPQLSRLKSKIPSMIVPMYRWNSTKQRPWSTSEQWHMQRLKSNRCSQHVHVNVTLSSKRSDPLLSNDVCKDSTKQRVWAAFEQWPMPKQDVGCQLPTSCSLHCHALYNGNVTVGDGPVMKNLHHL